MSRKRQTSSDSCWIVCWTQSNLSRSFCVCCFQSFSFCTNKKISSQTILQTGAGTGISGYEWHACSSVKTVEATWTVAFVFYSLSSTRLSTSHGHQTIAKVLFSRGDKLLCMISWYPAVWDVSISGIKHDAVMQKGLNWFQRAEGVKKGNCYCTSTTILYCAAWYFYEPIRRSKATHLIPVAPIASHLSFFYIASPDTRSSNKISSIYELYHSKQFYSPARAKETTVGAFEHHIYSFA